MVTTWTATTRSQWPRAEVDLPGADLIIRRNKIRNEIGGEGSRFAVVCESKGWALDSSRNSSLRRRNAEAFEK